MARYDLTGKTALVTGAARGIGFETAKLLVARGASVALVDLDAGATQDAAAQIHDSQAIGIGADVTDRGALQRAVAATVERFGGLDVVVANAGIVSRTATLRATPPETAERVLEVNLMGVYRTVDVALPEIVRTGGHVVVVASVYAFGNGVGVIPYAMSKAGVEQLGWALRLELAPHGASASVAYFGFIDTEMVRRTLDADPTAELMVQRLPAPLRKRVHPRVAAAGIVAGIERRRPRIIRPRRWTVMSLLRGVLNPLLDAAMERDAKTAEVVREFDGRSGEEQPTTA